MSSERIHEAAARRRLEKTVDDVVRRLRDLADQVEREARSNVETAARPERVYESQNYGRVAGQLVHAVVSVLPNLKLDSVMDAASDADVAWSESYPR